jgi:putative membrane protein
MRRPTIRLATIAVGLGLAVAPTWATASAHRPTHHAVRGHHGHHHARVVSAADFLPKAAAGNRFEIVTGQLAQQRAQSSAIKDLGAMFVTDHTAALAQVTAVASQLGVDLPAGLDPEQQAIVDQLQTLSGADFDAAWLKAQLVAHRKALLLHLRAAIRGENDAIRTLGQGALPVITKHLGELIDLALSGHDAGASRSAAKA